MEIKPTESLLYPDTANEIKEEKSIFIGNNFNKDLEIRNNMYLEKKEFYNCTFECIDFRESFISCCIFEECTFENCIFDDTCTIVRCQISKCEFNVCTFDRTLISGCTISECEFKPIGLGKSEIILSTIESPDDAIFVEDSETIQS